MTSPTRLSPNRSRAIRYDADHVLIGLGARQPQVVGPLRARELATVVTMGALTKGQWMSAFRTLDTRVASALRDAVSRTMPEDLHRLRVAVHGSGPIARSATELLEALGAVIDTRHPELSVTIGAPGIPPAAAPLRLLVELGSDQIVVGPLLRSRDGPCADCLQTLRLDLDRNWQRVRPQVFGLGLQDDEPTCPPELAHVAVGLVGVVCRGVAVDQLLPPGVAMSMATPDPRLRHHVWPTHPGCECQLRRAG